ncbi:FecR family protein [Pedobacter hartonius]|uniref:FecR family protein n=1 Tax=Pedobacter hartonius TaxID=425514 RepID=A0A1H4H7Y4_9SPHI|nr:FecR family protein [Pedobacter hartonius]SEB17741.1 FecR family protein [Pedobacter hartonius]
MPTQQELEQLLYKYTSGTSTAEENRLLEAWFQRIGQGQKAEDLSDADKYRMLEAFKKLPGFAKDQWGIAPVVVSREPVAAQPVPKIRQLLNSRVIAVAACLLVLGSVWIITLTLRDNTPLNHKTVLSAENQIVQTGTGQIKKIRLKDGSTLHLNANSRVQIPGTYASTNRIIQLEEGEAYFEVVKDKKHPFIVITQALRVRVLGTAFNVSSYRESKSSDVRVNHGKVEVSDNKKSVLAVLKKNQAITYDRRTGKAEILTTDGFYANLWISGSVLLTQASFSDVALQLKNLYGVKLISSQNKIKGYSFNLTIKKERSLEATLDVICGIHQNKYRRKGNVIEIY